MNLPSIEELQTLNASSDVQKALYLVPAEENEGVAGVVVANGWPLEAQNGRWRAIALYGAGMAGSTVLAWLKRHEGVLLAASNEYFGEGSWEDVSAQQVDELQERFPL